MISMIDRRLLVHFDWIIFFLTISLSVIGIINIYSATLIDSNNLYEKQLIWFLIGLSFMLLITFINYIHLERLAYPIYGLSITLLIATLLFGRTTAGATRWLNLGFVSFQPSEFAKIAIIIILAKTFCNAAKIPVKGMSTKDLMLPSLLVFIPFILIAKQPDMGTAILTFFIFASMVIFAKVRVKTLIGIIAVSLPMIPIGWHFLKGYQKARLMSFRDPTLDPLGTGYHILQSKIAIGSGGILGNGFTHGTQGQLRFLPEHHTDFIFSVLAEEWGFAGSFIVLTLYFTLILWGLNIAQNAKDRLGAFLAFGVSSMLLWHIVINIGMVTGMLPVVGVPLPFMSYGGSFLVTTMIGAGILANVSMRRFIF